MNLLTALMLGLLLPLLAINVFFVVELLAGLRACTQERTDRPELAGTIIVPAHNEADGIASMLEALIPAARQAGCEILVVADNCTDATAAIARAAGAQVVERSDPEQRGKGYALAFARDNLHQAPPAAVIILDADCRTDPDSLRALAASAITQQRPAQAINLLLPAPEGSAMVQVSTFAFLIKNKFRQRGLQRLTGEVHLTGTGMALPWALFAKADLATASIVEDLRLGIELSARGSPPMLVENSFVWSPHAAHGATKRQRQRWEGGFLAVARRTAPGMIGEGLRRGDGGLALRGLDLLVPPLALLGLINMAVLLGLLALTAAGSITALPVLAVAGSSGLIALTLLLAWWREGRPFLSARSLVRLPLYALWKVPMYLGLFRQGAPAEWQRALRPGEKVD